MDLVLASLDCESDLGIRPVEHPGSIVYGVIVVMDLKQNI